MSGARPDLRSVTARPFDIHRFASRFRLADNGCWEWTGQTMPNGYGRYHTGGRLQLAHRVAYEQYVGTIRDGQQLDHICRNRGCVNPWHLESVTHRENVLRGSTVAARNASATHCPQGHAYDEANTYRWPGLPQSRQCRTCHNARTRARRAAR